MGMTGNAIFLNISGLESWVQEGGEMDGDVS